VARPHTRELVREPARSRIWRKMPFTCVGPRPRGFLQRGVDGGGGGALWLRQT
jgi:hypothetical protein